MITNLAPGPTVLTNALVSLRSVPEVDAEVEDLLRVAYEQNA